MQNCLRTGGSLKVIVHCVFLWARVSCAKGRCRSARCTVSAPARVGSSRAADCRRCWRRWPARSAAGQRCLVHRNWWALVATSVAVAMLLLLNAGASPLSVLAMTKWVCWGRLLATKVTLHATRQALLQAAARVPCDPATKIGKREGSAAVSAELRTQQREQCLVLVDGQNLSGAHRPSLGRPAIGIQADFSNEVFHGSVAFLLSLCGGAGGV